ncbi:MAG: hypothetical protein LC640_02950, partial [Frankia sp.]|nr:hypothetical protein [Frankia sp.]
MLRRARLARLALLVAVAALVAPFVSVSSADAACAAAVRTRVDGWDEIRAPVFPGGARALVDFAVVPSAPSLLFATDGQVVMRSTDAGCTWTESFTPGALTSEPLPVVSVSTLTIRAIEVSPGPGRGDATPPVYVLGTNLLRPVVMRSDDAGETWTDASIGLPPEATAPKLRVSA